MKRRGFTLLEVMIALAVLGLALTVLIKSSAGSILAAEDAHMMGVATDLARGKMYDIEERLLKEGFTDTDQSQTDFKPFDEEGWPNVFYKYETIQIEFPNFDELQAIAQDKAKAAGSGSAAAAAAALGSGSASALGSALGSSFSGSNDPLNTFQNSALGGMLGMMGMLGGSKGGDITGAQGASMIQSKFDMFQQILKVTVRKVRLTVKWQVMGRDRDMVVVAFFTDPAAMDKVLNGMGASETAAPATGSGSGSGSNRRTGSGSGK